MTERRNGSSGWVASLEGESGERLGRALASLPLEALAHYPTPKRGGLPIGREVSLLARRARGRSIQLYPSGLWRAHSAFASTKHRLLYRGFTLGDAMPRGAWEKLLGASDARFWEEKGFLIGAGADFRAVFRVVAFEGFRLIADAFAEQGQFKNRVHVGRDTVELFDALRQTSASRYLDVGTGSGALLFAAGRTCSEAVGVDINPRAVAVAKFNARLNEAHCRVLEGSIFDIPALGRFDLVTWNLPFHFFPPEERANNVDGDGGDMGIDLTLRFVDALPTLLTAHGCAYLLTSSPELHDGRGLLLQALAERALRLRLDVRVTFLHALWSPSRRRFHSSHGIRRIDNVIVEVRLGMGRLDRVAAPAVQRAIDWVQQLRYSAAG